MTLWFPEGVIEEFNRLGYTIGGMTIWSSNRVGGAMTINGARGFDRGIADRFDLTLECVRRYYLGESSPGLLGDTLARYPAFFALFGDFAGFADFFSCKTSWMRSRPQSGSTRRSRTSPPRRFRETSMRTSVTTNARLSSSNRATGASPVTSATAADRSDPKDGTRMTLERHS